MFCLSQEVFDQNFQTHDDQNEPAEKFGACLVAVAEDAADLDAEDAASEGCQADSADRRKDVDLQKGERYADSECVDARCDGEGKHGTP